MITLELSQGRVAFIDDCDGHLAEYKWHCDGGYAKRNCRKTGKHRVLRLHREILNAPKGVHVDHRNGDKLDNRRCNLRLCSNAENQWNRGRKSNSSSGLKGVSFNTERRKWHATISLNGQHIHLGRFRRRRHAAAVYDIAAKYLHGDFAKPNNYGCLPSDYNIKSLLKKLEKHK